ncbi:MAG TPA: alginate export family protein [Pseudobdellovibrionaceae bacterium]|nr:alginate export family protein [Pseudobdellovibrionaceae bacterium]
MKRKLMMSGLLLFSSAASAMSLDWTGTYRAEWLHLDRPSLASPAETKSYGLHYLSLSPKIVASDGINIVGKFDVLGNNDPAYMDSQTGMLFGGNEPNAGDDSANNTMAQSKSFTPFRVSQLYLTVNQEYGSLLVGRAPFEFGLGMLYSAGNGAFDHWLTTSDFVAYKFIVGNLSFTPMIGRTHIMDWGPNPGMTQDEIIQVQYDSKDTGSMIGAMMARRKGSQSSNDITDTAIGGVGPADGGYSMTTTGFTFGRTWESFKFKMEAQFLKGSYGIRTAGGENIENSSYGVALEMDFPRPQAKWEGGLKMGVASGDDPGTTAQEGFFFHRNYDVAMLLFNHRLGQRDFFRTNELVKDSTHSLSDSLDDETISNVIYVAPEFRYAWNPRVSVKNTLIYAQLMANSTGTTDLKKDLGLEWDISVDYQARENVRWENRVGLLFPGGAFKDGASDLQNGFTYGFETRAAITF